MRYCIELLFVTIGTRETRQAMTTPNTPLSRAAKIGIILNQPKIWNVSAKLLCALCVAFYAGVMGLSAISIIHAGSNLSLQLILPILLCGTGCGTLAYKLRFNPYVEDALGYTQPQPTYTRRTRDYGLHIPKRPSRANTRPRTTSARATMTIPPGRERG